LPLKGFSDPRVISPESLCAFLVCLGGERTSALRMPIL
jgi:hypothetical protein